MKNPSLGVFLKNKNKFLNSFKKNGYLLVRGVFQKSDFDNIRLTIKLNLKKYIKNLRPFKNLDEKPLNNNLILLRKKNPKKFAHFFDTLQTSTAIIQFWTKNEILNIIKHLLSSNKNELSATDLLLRIDSPVDERNKLDWHQDSAYFKQNKYGFNGLNCWVPLSDIYFNMGPLEILSQSHKIGCVNVKKKRDRNFGSLQRKLPLKLTDKFNYKKFEMKLGDILFMNMDTMHRSGSNFSKIFRFSAICRYHKTTSNDFNPGLNIYRYSDRKLNKKIHGF